MARGKIVTVYEYPPIPTRRFDWRASHEGEEERNHCGWGATEAEAIEDLRRLDWECADSDELFDLELAEVARMIAKG